MNIDDIIENAQLKGRVIGLEAQVETLTAEVRCLEAVIRSHERVDCLLVTSLKKQLGEGDAEVARLKAEVERLEHQVNYWRIEAETDNARWLRCLEDKERLTKAGDAMADRLMYQGYPATVPAWDAAKGVQS